MTATSELYAAARDYLSRGWAVLAIGRDKRPLIPWRRLQATRPGAGDVRQWFRRSDVTGVGVLCGPISGGLVVRDFDDAGAYARWGRAYPELAERLPTVRTARGYHLYMRHAGTDRIIKQPDGELRGGGYVLAPPSRHPTGSRYEWIGEAPRWDIPSIDPHAVGLVTPRQSLTTSRVTERQRNRETEKQRKQSNGVFAAEAVAPHIPDAALEVARVAALPSRVGERNRCIFELARALKAVPGLADAAAVDLRGAVRLWHERALPIIGTKPFDDTWSDFCVAWPAVRFPKGQGPMALIAQQVDAGGLPATAEPYDAPETRRLVAICRELQRVCGDAPFFLASRTAAEMSGLPDHVTAWRRLRMLETDGVLRAVQRGDQHRATRYRYVGDENLDGPT